DQRELKQMQDYSRRQNLDPQEERFLKYNVHYYRWRLVRNISLGLILLTVFALLYPIMRNWIFPDPSIVTSLFNDGAGSLRQAITLADSGTTITFASGLKGTIHLTSDLPIAKSITI